MKLLTDFFNVVDTINHFEGISPKYAGKNLKKLANVLKL